jgi:hypothetical protein
MSTLINKTLSNKIKGIGVLVLLCALIPSAAQASGSCSRTLAKREVGSPRISQVLCARIYRKSIMGIVYQKASQTDWAIYQQANTKWTKASTQTAAPGNNVTLKASDNKLTVTQTPTKAVSPTPITATPAAGSGYTLCPETITLYVLSGMTLVPKQDTIELLCGDAPTSAPPLPAPSPGGFSLCPETISLSELQGGVMVSVPMTLQVPCGTSVGDSPAPSPSPGPSPAPVTPIAPSPPALTPCGPEGAIPSPYEYGGVSVGSYSGFGTNNPWGQALSRTTNEVSVGLLTASAVRSASNPDEATVTATFGFNVTCNTQLRFSVAACFTWVVKPCGDTTVPSSWTTYEPGQGQTVTFTTPITAGGAINTISVGVQELDQGSAIAFENLNLLPLPDTPSSGTDGV